MAISHGTFSGEPVTVWLTEAGIPDRRMRLVDAFAFTDPAGREWRVPSGYDAMNGASIPRALWSLVGSPYTGDYRRASIVHDHACDQSDNATERRAADRMFYRACRAGGCSTWEALLLYLGVRIGAHVGGQGKWKKAVEEPSRSARLAEHPLERRLRDDYRAIVDAVAAPGESDDAEEIEARADAALARVVGD